MSQEPKTFTIPVLPLDSGATLPSAVISYLTFGTLALDGRNAVLIAHGYTSGPDMVDPTVEAAEGSWSELVGPGAPIDTDRFFVVCPNMLGSSYGSSNGASIDPATGRPYGLRFPAITVADIVRSQRLLLDHLGVRHLIAVAGPSYGGMVALQWGIADPDFVAGLVVAVASPSAPPVDIDGLVARLGQDPNWRGGDYYDGPGLTDTLTAMRVQTLKSYGIDARLATRFPDDQARDAEIRRMAGDWARVFDANSLIILLKAMQGFDLTSALNRIKAHVLYVLSRSDRLFPPTLAPRVMAQLASAGVQADYVEIDSEDGHFASGTEAAQWGPQLRWFIESCPD